MPKIPPFFEVARPNEGSESDLTNENYVLQYKYNGSRCIIYILKDTIQLIGRSYKNDWHDYFPEIVRDLKQIQPIVESAILDSELTYFDGENNDVFLTTLANPETKKGLTAKVEIFDIISLNGNSLENVPFENRMELLRMIIPENLQHVELVKTYPNSSETYKAYHGEGVVLKLKGSTYFHGYSQKWLKVKHLSVEEAIVVGCIEGNNSRSSTFGSLILAQVDSNGKLRFIGKTSGFNGDEQNRLYAKMQSLRTANKQLSEYPRNLRVKFWVKPKIVISVRFTDKTPKGKLHMPVYICERTDKSAEECNTNQIPKEIIKERAKHKPSVQTYAYTPDLITKWLK